MEFLEAFEKENIQQLTNVEEGSIKIGETVHYCQKDEDWQRALENSMASYVILGIPEDIGTKTNNFPLSTSNSFSSFVAEFLNFQDNLYLSGEDCFILGSIHTEDIATRLKFLTMNQDELFHLVEEIDQRVQKVVEVIFKAGKKPIVIGGGQNNSYPLLKSLAATLQKPVNCFNVAAHTSLQPPEGRSARNGFSYALMEGFLEQYYVFGLHESEIPHSIYEFILANYQKIGFTRFEAILKNDPYMFEALEEARSFLEEHPKGMEVNMNCISDNTLSPDYPDGFLLREVRQLIRRFAPDNDVRYLHLCEASSGLPHQNRDKITGKSLALLVSDFIKATTYSEEEE